MADLALVRCTHMVQMFLPLTYKVQRECLAGHPSRPFSVTDILHFIRVSRFKVHRYHRSCSFDSTDWASERETFSIRHLPLSDCGQPAVLAVLQN
jgi:hypothetical protein